MNEPPLWIHQAATPDLPAGHDPMTCSDCRPVIAPHRLDERQEAREIILAALTDLEKYGRIRGVPERTLAESLDFLLSTWSWAPDAPAMFRAVR